LVPFRIKKLSENIDSKAKVIDRLTITLLVLITILITPLFVNTMYKSFQNALILPVRSEFYKKFDSFKKELTAIAEKEEIGFLEIGFLGKKDSYSGFSSTMSEINDSSVAYVEIFISPKMAPLDEELIINCKLCSVKQLNSIKISAHKAYFDKQLNWTSYRISRYLSITQEINNPGLSISGVKVEAEIVPMLILIVSILLRHFLNEYANLISEFQKTYNRYLRSLNTNQRIEFEKIVKLITPVLLNHSFTKYLLYPISNKGVKLFMFVFMLIITLFPISYSLTSKYFGINGFYYSLTLFLATTSKLLFVYWGIRIVLKKFNMLDKITTTANTVLIDNGPE